MVRLPAFLSLSLECPTNCSIVTLDDKPISEATVEANEEGESEEDRLLI
jgi:hypothetical protein